LNVECSAGVIIRLTASLNRDRTFGWLRDCGPDRRVHFLVTIGGLLVIDPIVIIIGRSADPKSEEP